MKSSQRALQRAAQNLTTAEKYIEVADKLLPDLEYHMNFALTSLVQFYSMFELQLASIKEAQHLSKMRIVKLETSNNEILFWNHLKINILNRQKSENAELIRATGKVANQSEQVAQAERSVMEEANKARGEDEKEAEANLNARVVTVKNIAGRNKNDPRFNLSDKSLLLSVERGNEINQFELKFLPEKAKYVPTQEYHPKAMALISQFNFHKSLSRLQHQLTELVNTA